MRNVGISLPVDGKFGPRQHAELARLADDCGFSTVSVGEIASTDAFVTLAHLAATTKRVVLSAGIVSIYSRPPALAAMGFASLLDLAPGRIVAALGTSTPIIVNDWWGGEFEAPAPRMRDYIRIMRSALAGEAVDYEGPQLASRGFRLGLPPSELPILVGAVGPRLLEVAAAEADGAMLTMVRPSELENFWRVLQPALAQNDVRGFPVSVSGLRAYAGDRVEEYRVRSRRLLASYLHVSTHRRRLIEAAPELSDALRRDSRDWPSALPAELVDDLAPSSADAIAGLVERHWEAGVGEVLLHLTGASSSDLEGCQKTIRAVASTLGLRNTD